MPGDERDRQFERALAQHLRRAATQPDCPDAEILAAYHERMLAPEEMTRWKEHIAGCSVCQESLALVEATESLTAQVREENNIYSGEFSATMAARPSQEAAMPPRALPAAGAKPAAHLPAAVQVMKPRTTLRWAIPVGAIAAGILVWISVHSLRHESKVVAPSIEVAQNRAAPPENRTPEVRDEQNLRAQSPPRRELQELSKVPVATGSFQAGAGLGSTGAPNASSELEAKKAASLQASPSSAEGGGFGSVHLATPPAKNVPQDKKSGKPEIYLYKTDAAPTVPPSVSESVEVTAAADQIQTKPAAPPPPAPAAGGAAKQAVGGVADKQRAKDQEVRVMGSSEEVTSNQVVQMPIEGRNYQAQVLSVLVAQDRRVIAVPGSNRAWRVGEQGKIEFTSDGGRNWKPQTSGVNASLTSGSAPSKKVCWIAGKSGVLLVTSDTGKHWKQVATPITGDLGNVTATDARHARIRDVDNRSGYETSDGGKTWSPVVIE